MPRWWSTRRFDMVETALIAGLAVVTTAYLVRSLDGKRLERISYVAYTSAQEGERLADRYGPSRYSRNEEEWIIRDYFQDRRNGVFVDVGANHYRNDSNTYYLETKLGWSGVAIDPQGDFAAGYRSYRPRTHFFQFFIGDTSDANTAFYLPEGNSLEASADQRFAEGRDTETPGARRETRAVVVPTIRLTDLLGRAGVQRFDLLSVDVELAEPGVLAGFDIDRFKPSLVCIEAHPQVRQQILDYFTLHGYVVLGRYLRADLQNLYFSPITPAARGPASPVGADSEQTPKK